MNDVVVVSIDRLYAEVVCGLLKSDVPEVKAEPLVANVKTLARSLKDLKPGTVMIDVQTAMHLQGSLFNLEGTFGRVLLVPEARHEHISVALQVGASSIVQTSADRDVLRHAFRFALNGGSFFPAGLWDKAAVRRDYGREERDVIQGVEVTRKEKGILIGLGRGSSNKVIAYDLGLSEGTVKVYLSRLCKKFSVSNRTQLLLKVIGKEEIGFEKV